MGIPSHLRCDHVVEIATDYLECALPPASTAELEQHLLICGDCERYVGQLRSLASAARAPDEPAADDAPAPEAVLAIFRRLKGGGP